MKHLEAFSFYNRFNKYDKLVNTIFQNINFNLTLMLIIKKMLN